jgi:hypothetical protein
MLTKLLEKRQQELRDRNAGLTQPGLVYASQLEPVMLAALKACREANAETLAALASAIPTAIRFTESVIAAEESSPAERTRAADTIFFLMNALQRQERVLAQAATRKEIAAKNRAHHQSKVERARADAAQVPITIAKERKRIQKVLDKAAQEQERDPDV